jgi:hypothetical protein
MDHKAITFLAATTEEVPHYFEFKKVDIMGYHPTMANLNYDPFPNANDNDTVRKEIIARKLVLRARLKAPAGFITMADRIEYEGHSFLLNSIQENCGEETDVFEIEGFTFLTPCDPMQALARLRTMWAEAISP